jgi:2-succinyl-6-hydroxy-2,4-cyclohexadiene-1-carboxylate synthase
VASVKRPVVCLHGFTGTPRCFERVCDLLPGVSVLAPVVRGHDGERVAGAPAPFEAEVDRLARLVAGHGGGRAHLVGYSLGARLALGLLVRHPALFASATLVAVHPGLQADVERDARGRADDGWCRLLEAEGLARFVDAWERQPLFASQARLDDVTLQAQRARRLSHDPQGLAWALRSLGLARMPSYWAALSALEVPVHLMAGQLDDKFTALARSAAGRLACELTVVDGAGHNVVLERPDVIAAAIRKGLRS